MSDGDTQEGRKWGHWDDDNDDDKVDSGDDDIDNCSDNDKTVVRTLVFKTALFA